MPRPVIVLLVAASVVLPALAQEPSPADAPPNLGLDILECDGPDFDPAWGSFKQELIKEPLPSEALLSRASEVLALVDETEDLFSSVAAFGARLRGDLEAAQALSGLCVYGAVTAYWVAAVHLGVEGEGKAWLARALLPLAKKLAHDFLESSSWPVRSFNLVAALHGLEAERLRALATDFALPCWLRLGCPGTLVWAEENVRVPPPPLSASWPASVTAVGLHTTSTLEVVTALQGAVREAWGRGGGAADTFEVKFAGHPCPAHSASAHQCQMRCELLGVCEGAGDLGDPLAEFIEGAVEGLRFREKDSYTLGEARTALRWAEHRLAPLVRVDMLVCTFPTVLCVLLHELFPDTPQLFVAIANPLFAAPGCAHSPDSTVRECETEDAREYLSAMRAMLSGPNTVAGIAAYTVTAALVGYQTGLALPLAGKAGRYLPKGATWQPQRPDVLLARSRFLETTVGANLRNLIKEFGVLRGVSWSCVPQQEVAAYMSYEEMGSFRGVLILPQDLGLHKFTEHYAMGMPIWMPGREWAYRLQIFIPWGMVAYSGSWVELDPGLWQGDAIHPPGEDWPSSGPAGLARRPFFNAQTVPYPVADAVFWYEFSEYVSYPAVQFFNSIPDLLVDVEGADLAAVSGQMRQFRAELWRTTRAVYAEAAGRLAAAAAAGVASGAASREEMTE